MNETFKEFVINKLIDDGDINEESLRDYRIRKKYRELKKQGLTGKEAREKLADEFNRADKTIQKIIYNS